MEVSIATSVSAFTRIAELSGRALPPDGKVITIPFLEACSQVLPVVDKLGAAFMLVRSDVNGNIMRLEGCVAKDPARHTCIFSIVEEEVSAGTTKDSSSATNGLLWLKRAMEFLVALLRRLHDDRDVHLPSAAQEAYAATLQPFHGWISSTAFNLAMRMAPSRESFLSKLQPSPGGDVMGEMHACTQAFAPVLAAVQAYLSDHGLDDPAKV